MLKIFCFIIFVPKKQIDHPQELQRRVETCRHLLVLLGSINVQLIIFNSL